MNQKKVFKKIQIGGLFFLCFVIVKTISIIAAIDVLGFVSLGGMVLTGIIIVGSLYSDYKNMNDWYEQILDSVYLPMSVTDMDMNWTFINKPVKDIIGVTRDQIVGKQCSNWNADICNTADCGIAKLRSGISTSYFTNEGINKNFQVDTAYLYSRKDKTKKIGHMELVSDITTRIRLSDAIEQLKKTSFELSETVENEANTATEISVASKKISQNLNSVNNIAVVQSNFVASLEEISASIVSVAHSAAKADENTRQNITEAKASEEKIKQTLESVFSINEDLLKISSRISELNEKTENVDEILKVMDSIAALTNLLAMNAAIEAAHAGEAGKGFSVVAQEVRKLAESAQQSSKEIENIIKDIKNSVQEILLISNAGNARVRSNIESTEQLLTTLDEIVRKIIDTGDMVSQIDSISKEQAVATQGVLEDARELQDASSEIKSAVSEQYNGITHITNTLNALVGTTEKNTKSVKILQGVIDTLEL